MTETKDKKLSIIESREMEDRLGQIILACGECSLKEKVTLLYLAIDFIFENNKELMPAFCDEVTIH